MKDILRIAKKSAKKNFQNLREKSPLFSPVLSEEIQVTKLFFDHIIYHKRRDRGMQEIIERILIIPFLEDIIRYGILEETRNTDHGNSYQISLKKGEDIFSVVISKSQKKYILLSCFRKYSLTKKGSS